MSVGPYQFQDPCVPGENSPLVGATVQLFDTYGVFVTNSTTDENGEVTFYGLPGGRYSVQAIYPPCPTSIPTVAPSITPITYQFDDPCVPGGNSPLVGAAVQLLDTFGVFVSNATTDNNGEVTFYGLPRGRYSVQAIYPPCPTYKPTASPSITPFIIDQVSCPCNGENLPLAGVPVSLVGAFGQTSETTTSDSEGYYSFQSQPPGSRYSIVVDCPEEC